MEQAGHPPDIGRPNLTRRYDVDWLRVLGMMPLFFILFGMKMLPRRRPVSAPST